MEDGHDIRTIQKLLGHRDIRATMIYTLVLIQQRGGVGSPDHKQVRTLLSARCWMRTRV